MPTKSLFSRIGFFIWIRLDGLKKITSLTDLTPDPQNANSGTERGQYMVEHSLESYGAGRSILADANGVVIAGNKTLQAAADMGLPVEVIQSDGKKLIVVQRTDLDLLTDKAARELAYADNRASEVGLAWDTEQLLADMDSGVDLAQFFREDELEALFADILPPEPVGDAEPQLDRAAELQAEWKTERGQVWVIPSKSAQGKAHRVMCGDSRTDDLKALLNGDDIDLIFTDPPYGINVVQGIRATIGGAKPVTIGTIRSRQTYPFGGVKIRGTDGSANVVDANFYEPVYGDDEPFDPTYLLGLGKNQIIWGGNYFASKLPDSRCWLVWDKNNTGNFADAELAWTSFKTGVQMYRWTWNGLVREGSRDLEGVKRVHPTQKPVGMFCEILNDYSEGGFIVCDLYLGSGSTIVACEQTGRIGYGMEISPAYVAVILQRLKDIGLAPTLA